MTLGQVFYDGFFDDSKSFLDYLKAVALLSVYVVNNEEEYNCLLLESEESADNKQRRILESMMCFEYFKKIKIDNPESVLAELNRIRVSRTIYRHCHWIGTLAPDVYIKNHFFLVYFEKRDEKVVERKVSLLRLFFRKPKSWVECMLEELRVKD